MCSFFDPFLNYQRASYRDLLGTAGSIIEMDSQMQQVESYLATMGMKCNGRLLGRGGINLLRLGRETGSKGASCSAPLPC